MSSRVLTKKTCIVQRRRRRRKGVRHLVTILNTQRRLHGAAGRCIERTGGIASFLEDLLIALFFFLINVFFSLIQTELGIRCLFVVSMQVLAVPDNNDLSLFFSLFLIHLNGCGWPHQHAKLEGHRF